jgi:hypothetical protein
MIPTIIADRLRVIVAAKNGQFPKLAEQEQLAGFFDLKPAGLAPFHSAKLDAIKNLGRVA